MKRLSIRSTAVNAVIAVVEPGCPVPYDQSFLDATRPARGADRTQVDGFRMPDAQQTSGPQPLRT
ncbi:hypothetical protein [Streptomyces sp. NPDC003077]|uniref:hypothetical protein n=1 Tax=Streptomyces sp. NPDC003077 TaxID=3154443 RepID=UPI0033A85861